MGGLSKGKKEEEKKREKERGGGGGRVGGGGWWCWWRYTSGDWTTIKYDKNETKQDVKSNHPYLSNYLQEKKKKGSNEGQRSIIPRCETMFQ